MAYRRSDSIIVLFSAFPTAYFVNNVLFSLFILSSLLSLAMQSFLMNDSTNF